MSFKSFDGISTFSLKVYYTLLNKMIQVEPASSATFSASHRASFRVLMTNFSFALASYWVVRVYVYFSNMMMTHENKNGKAPRSGLFSSFLLLFHTINKCTELKCSFFSALNFYFLFFIFLYHVFTPFRLYIQASHEPNFSSHSSTKARNE